MLVDLGRNDLGRVCRPGTVEVVEFMDVRRYSHIMHLESTVTGRSMPRATRRSTWCSPPSRPAPCPARRRCGRWRSSTSSRCPAAALYGGVVGYLDFAGDADAAIAIRTALLRDGVAYVQAGGGIVADSDPPTEDQESQNKAAAVVRAISVAQTFSRWRRRLMASPSSARDLRSTKDVGATDLCSGRLRGGRRARVAGR